MRVVIQRVKEASVSINQQIHAEINEGLLILLGIENADTVEDADYLIRKIPQLRIFNDKAGIMNLSAIDVQAQLLIISQFTLHAKTKKGNRPSYIDAARPEQAIPLYEYVLNQLRQSGLQVKSGVFGANMQISLINDGPVTLIIDTREAHTF
jgi:D-aminoacyl-tRNA deacylase